MITTDHYNKLEQISVIQSKLDTYLLVKNNYRLNLEQRKLALISWSITKNIVIIPIMIAITKKLGFTIDDVYQEFVKINEVTVKI